MKIFRSKSKKKLYFVVRSEYEIPLGHRVVEFEADSILDWVQNHWVTREVSQKHSEKLVGRVYDFDSIWAAMLDYGKNPPRNTAELKAWAELISVEGEVIFNDDYISVITNDDEISVEWCFFTEDFAKLHPERVNYVLHPTWEFPLAFEERGQEINLQSVIPLKEHNSSEQGSTYCVFLTSRDGITIEDITGSFKFEGVRLPEFGKYLLNIENPIKQGRDGEMRPFWEDEVILLKAHLVTTQTQSIPQLLESLGDKVNNLNANRSPIGNQLYKDPAFMSGDNEKLTHDQQTLENLIQSQGENSVWSYNMGKPRVQTSDHFCQIRFHNIVYSEGDQYGRMEYLSSVFYFDDLWVEANPLLAESLIRYSKGEHFIKGKDEKKERSIDKPYVKPAETKKLTDEEKKQEEIHLSINRRMMNIENQYFELISDQNSVCYVDPKTYNSEVASPMEYALHIGYKTKGVKIDSKTDLPISLYDLVAANMDNRELTAE